MCDIEQSVLDQIELVKTQVIEAFEILNRRNPVLAQEWNLFPDSRRSIAYKFAAMFLLGRCSGYTSLTPDAQFVWSAACNDIQWRDLFPEFFTDK